MLSERQSGFRPGHSTLTCLTEIVEIILDNIDKGRLIGAIFLDLKRAFDVIPHHLIFQKMSYYGISGVELEWFKSYFLNRQHCVYLQGTTSNYLTVKSGVPQGSILGPLIFCLYVNDICNLQIHPETRVSLYADDTALFNQANDRGVCENNLQNDFNYVVRWLECNGMCLNATKTKTILFGSKGKIKNDTISVKYKNDSLESVDSIKYLGVMIDKHLTWSLHVQNVIKKVSKTIACIRRVQHFMSKKNLIMLYYSLILPHFDYCNVVWGNTSKANITKLQKLQNRYARLILRVDYFTPQSNLMNALNWQSVYQRIKYQQCLMIFKILNNLTPLYLNPCVSKRPVYYSTRYAINSPLFIPKYRTDYKMRTLAVTGAKLFNKLPLYIQNCKSLQSFKMQIRTLQFLL